MAFPFPIYDFSTTVDYTVIQNTVKQIVSYLNEKRYNNDLSAYSKAVMAEVNPILSAMRYDASGDLNQTARWQKDVKTAYLMLYPLTNS